MPIVFAMRLISYICCQCCIQRIHDLRNILCIDNDLHHLLIGLLFHHTPIIVVEVVYFSRYIYSGCCHRSHRHIVTRCFSPCVSRWHPFVPTFMNPYNVMCPFIYILNFFEYVLILSTSIDHPNRCHNHTSSIWAATSLASSIDINIISEPCFSIISLSGVCTIVMLPILCVVFATVLTSSYRCYGISASFALAQAIY